MFPCIGDLDIYAVFGVLWSPGTNFVWIQRNNCTVCESHRNWLISYWHGEQDFDLAHILVGYVYLLSLFLFWTPICSLSQFSLNGIIPLDFTSILNSFFSSFYRTASWPSWRLTRPLLALCVPWLFIWALNHPNGHNGPQTPTTTPSAS